MGSGKKNGCSLHWMETGVKDKNGCENREATAARRIQGGTLECDWSSDVCSSDLMMAAVLGACAPTARNTGETSEHGTAPAGAAQQETVDGVAEKESMVVTDADPTVTVCVYSVKSDKSGLKQNMDGIDGDELDAQELLDKMAEVGVIEEGITVDKFEQKDGALTLDLSSLKESSDKLVVMAIANTFIQNYEAKTLELSVAGEKIGDGPMSFEKNYKKVN